jgi:hypothetical protein
MRLRFISLLAAVALVLGLAGFASVTGAGAVSPSQQQCEADGGTFTRVNGTVTCIEETHVGNSENSQTTTDTTNGQGNIDNKTTSDCSGPGNSGDGSAHCK